MNNGLLSGFVGRRGLLVLAVIALVASSCSSGGSRLADFQQSSETTGTAASLADADARPPESDGTSNANESKSGPDTATGFLAIVTNADGSMVRWPEINGEIGDSEGQVTGPYDPSGWYEVSAPGYAKTWAHPVVTSGGFDILDVELTPLSSPLVIDGTAQIIDMYDGASISVPSGALPAGTWLTVTELPARHLSAPWAPVDGGNRTRIFSFESSGEDGAEIQPTGVLTLRLENSASLGGVTSLAAFDPDSGRWTKSGDCVEAGAAVDCTVSHFSLWTFVSGQPYSQPPDSEGGGSAEADAQARAEEAQQILDEDAETAAEELPARIQGLLEAAVAAAGASPSRATKDRLTMMIALADTYDLDTGGATGALGKAYEAVSSAVIDAAKGAKKPRCSYLGPLAGVVAEGETVGSVGASTNSKQVAVDLLTKIELECRLLWTGTIEYRFPAPEQWEIYSAMPPGAQYEDRGIDQWVETASVMINVDPDTGELHGVVSDAPGFVPLRYRIDMNDPPSICPGEFWDDITVEGVGSSEPRVGSGEVADLIRRAASGAGMIELEFDGSYKESRFSVSQPRLVGESGVRVQTQLDIYIFVLPCENISGSSVEEDTVVESYTTQLVDGFGYLSPVEPKVTLNEMLNSAQHTEPDGTIVIEGRRDLTVSMDLIVPFQEGTVTWKFQTESLFENYGDEG